MIKDIIFDYDGVIVDSFPTIHEIYMEACNKFGLKCPSSIKEFRKIYGYNKQECKKNLGLIPENFEEFDKIFAERVLEKSPEIFEGIENVLKNLSKRYKLFLVTDNLREEAVQKLQKFGLLNFFESVVGDKYNNGIRHISRKSLKINNLVGKFNLNKKEIIYIGDRDLDYDVAKEAEIYNIIIVDYGWGYSKDKIKQNILVKKPRDLLRAVDNINKKMIK